MSKKTLVVCACLVVGLLPPLVAVADGGHGHGGSGAARDISDEPDHHEGAATGAEGLVEAWKAVMQARNAIQADVESGALGEVHAKAEPLPALIEAVLEASTELDPGRRQRVEGAAKQVERIADALHDAADGGDRDRTRRELERLDRLLKLIRAQYSEGALEAVHDSHGGQGASVGHGSEAHAHTGGPLGQVESAPQATVRVQASDALRFEPKRIEIVAGVPTRIELRNLGAADHALVVKTPDGEEDWIHLHAPGGTMRAATFRLDHPGSYPLLCTIPGHTEGGMTGELVVRPRSEEPAAAAG